MPPLPTDPPARLEKIQQLLAAKVYPPTDEVRWLVEFVTAQLAALLTPARTGCDDCLDARRQADARADAAERERDEARAQFDRHVAWAEEQSTATHAALAIANGKWLAAEARCAELEGALKSRSQQFHEAERERTATFAGSHGQWMGRVFTKWEECPTHPCPADRKLLAEAPAPPSERAGQA